MAKTWERNVRFTVQRCSRIKFFAGTTEQRTQTKGRFNGLKKYINIQRNKHKKSHKYSGGVIKCSPHSGFVTPGLQEFTPSNFYFNESNPNISVYLFKILSRVVQTIIWLLYLLNIYFLIIGNHELIYLSFKTYVLTYFPSWNLCRLVTLTGIFHHVEIILKKEVLYGTLLFWSSNLFMNSIIILKTFLGSNLSRLQ